MGDDNNIPGALTFGTPGHLNTVVDSFENGKPATFDTSSFFTGNGNANGIGVIRNTDTYHSQNSFATYNDETNTYSYNIDKYTYGVLMPITNDEGIAMHNKAMEIRKNPGTYQVFTHNCNQVAQEILSAGGKDFASQ